MAELDRPGRNGRRWTEEDVATLRELAPRLTAKDVALRMGRSLSAIRSKAAHLRISLDLTDLPIGGRRGLPWDRVKAPPGDIDGA